ncbi:MAG TPA: alpha/beta hydrolase [Candidatus Acidoferrum sp.]|nr:alpha/beta hydrolase [Candidatus Acidoferrum sp.]
MSKTIVNDRSIVAGPSQYTTGSVVSRDGTTIGYRQLGRGPGLVVLHGAMESAQSHMQLAEALADTYTVYLSDRRGRGLSGAYGRDYSVQEDVEDLDALLSKTGAHFVFGVSSGAIICLEAALTLPAIHKAAIFEPPLMVNGSAPTRWLTRFDNELAEGHIAAAMVTGMKGAEMGPPMLNLMPRWLLERLTTMMMASEEKKAGADDVTMRMLAPTLHYDFQLVIEMDGALEKFRAVRAEVLLLGGSKSPAYLTSAVDALEKVLPHVTRVRFPGLGHEASGNTDRRGQPDRVAQELRRFFVEQQNLVTGVPNHD